ncbi:MAG TPA: hypothetical protein VFI31_19165 [Pirellulales bacterium]|nr:hypothetical protein [Pirellulales bacterium]
MYLRDIAVYADESIVEDFPSGFVSWFHRESCCITDFYASLLGKRVKTPDTVKVNLRFVPPEASAPSVRQLISVTDARWPFHFTEYAGLDAAGKKGMTLNAVQAALLWIANERRWDVSGLEETYANVIDRNLEFTGWSKKSWPSPNPKYRARIGFYFGLRSVDFFVGIFDRRRREVGRRPLGSVVPEMWMAHSVLKSQAKWIRRKIFRLQIDRVHFDLPKSWEADVSDLLI